MTIAPILHSVLAVNATAEQDVYELVIDLTDTLGERYTASYISRPDDVFGPNPTIRAWLVENDGAFTINPYVPPAPPTVAETRALMPALTARQLRLGLLNAGISPSQVTAAIDAMPAGIDKDKAQIEWEYATTFTRTHNLIGTVGQSLGLTDEQIDTMWTAALPL